MKPVFALVALAVATPGGALAQQVPAVMGPAVLVPTNTEVLVTLNDALDSRRVRKGQWFDVSVSRDVMIGNQVLIPRGTPGKGEIVFRTNKGAFGKSGKLELVLRQLDINGHVLPLTGRFRQEGQGNTGAVLGTVVLAGVIAGAFVTGHSAVIEQGREFKAFTAEAWSPRVSTMTYAAVSPPTPVAMRPIIASVATVAPGVGGMRPVAVRYAPAPAPLDSYQRALVAEQGVHGRNVAQGWSISD